MLNCLHGRSQIGMVIAHVRTAEFNLLGVCLMAFDAGENSQSFAPVDPTDLIFKRSLGKRMVPPEPIHGPGKRLWWSNIF